MTFLHIACMHKGNISMKCYPCGYAAHAPLIEHLMHEQPQLVMIDTRRVAWSKMPAWRAETLKATYGERYRQAGKSLGNLNYQRGGPIRLADLATGLRGLRHWLQHGVDLLLLCGCAVYEQCHLSTIVTALQADMPEVEVIMPEQLVLPGQSKCLSVRQPWTWLLTHPEVLAVCGVPPKTIENRDWSTRYRGPLLLHAGIEREGIFFNRRSGRLLPDYWAGKFGRAGERLARAMPQHRDAYATRAIVGSAELVDVVEESDSPWFVDGSCGLVLAEIRAITPPIRAVGSRRLFDVPPQALALASSAREDGSVSRGMGWSFSKTPLVQTGLWEAEA
jgi:hypothetical protein